MQSKVIAAEISKYHCSNKKNRLKRYILPEELTSILKYINIPVYLFLSGVSIFQRLF